MPYFDYDGDINVDVDEFLSACNRDDIDEIVDALVEDRYIKPSQIIHDSKMAAPEQLFEEALNKLHGKWNRISKTEEEIILAITNRF
jgi:hypothetical protein